MALRAPCKTVPGMYAISFDPAPTTPEEYDKMIAQRLETFGRVAKAVGLAPK